MDKHDDIVREEEKILKELTEKERKTIYQINKEWNEEANRNSNLPPDHPKRIDINDHYVEIWQNIQNGFHEEVNNRLKEFNKQFDNCFYSFDFNEKKLIKHEK